MLPHWLQLRWTYMYSPTEVLCLSTWRPGINSTGWNFFHMDLLWPIKSASTQGDFDLSAVPLESNPQTFSSMALILEKCQTCCLLAEQIPYFPPEPSRSPGLLWPRTPQTIIATATRKDSGQPPESGQSKRGGGNAFWGSASQNLHTQPAGSQWVGSWALATS